MYTPFSSLTETSQIWIYQSNRAMTESEISEIGAILEQFVNGWQSHGKPVTGSYEIVKGRFIVLAAERLGGEPSGCSIDSSVEIIRNIEAKFHISLLDRSEIAYEENEEIKSVNFRDLKKLVDDGQITPSTPIYNNNVSEMKDFANQWKQAASDSWVKRYF